MQTLFTPDEVIDTTRHWLQKAVIGLNLCPFAKSVYIKNQVRYAVSNANDVETLYHELTAELLRLTESDPQEIDTTLLIHPWVLNDFIDYNDFLHVADATVEDLGLGGEIQIASFHPQYQFADTLPDDVTNFTNRSPFPTLHLLRESSIARAVAAFPDASAIYEKNIETMHRLGANGWNILWGDDPLIPRVERNKKSDRT